ncbi:MAG: helix-turn-helix transcriptional regulator [Desulfobacteraceae bacterium]|nr:helix-turn-helix transcriptional regulator [Desulfobacteraceae bacterium]
MEQANKDKLAERLKLCMFLNCITQEEAARSLGVTHTSVYRWINGKASISKRLIVKVEEFISNMESKKGTVLVDTTKWPYSVNLIQEVVDYYSAPEKKDEFIKFLIKIDTEEYFKKNVSFD